MNTTAKKWFKAVIYIILGFYALLTVIPFLWAITTSFKPLSEIVQGGLSFIPKNFTLDNYKTVFTQEPLFPRWFFNSVFIAVSITLLNLLLNSMAGYALARISFFGSKFLFFVILAVLMIPFQVTLIPSFLLLKELDFLNTYQGIIVPGMVNATYIFMMRQFFLSFPTEMEEAAFIDGMGRGGIFFRLVLPLAKPALAAQAVFIFLGAWNNFLGPLIIMSEKAMFTLPIGLSTFRGEYISYTNLIMAASMMFTVPALLLYIYFNRYFIKGITFTGGK
ncbi:carbohydrate ABC transporter permease [Paenibacillus prosopidis]|uniref:Carbohydrate ABC transporter membrane protein 2 (CUT1 family) n=1 Tax=Paenibacillus prosopidis TaxID=630520 RepID=A0A368W6Q1_9BACL|nr:carbohydrate ABC transporter permease [Paenibacillus prosopidis]RCW50412.1 carbohydrate ABC transporter membrane protein 2 (CUT1 family) [Paenibacillus prosopidis]